MPVERLLRLFNGNLALGLSVRTCTSETEALFVEDGREPDVGFVAWIFLVLLHRDEVTAENTKRKALSPTVGVFLLPF